MQPKDDDLSIPDESVIDAVLGGSRDQFSILVDRYQVALFRVALSRLGTRECAEEVVQETLLSAFKWLNTYDRQYSFRTWLWTILLNQCKRRYHKQTRRPYVANWTDQQCSAFTEDESDLFHKVSREHGPEASLLLKERARYLEVLLSRLPENQADALRLRFFGELKFQEIADAMCCSLSSAKNRVKWGLAAMAKLMRSTSDSQRGQPNTTLRL